MIQITKKLIKYNYSGVNKPIYIVIHETDNSDIGADAERHFKYFNGGDRGASAHYFVDDKQIIQTVEHDKQSWHNGKKYVSNPAVPQCNNSNSIGIEICVNQDGDYSKAVYHTVELTKKLMKELNIPADRVIRHYDSCGKQCPAKMLREPKIWTDFKKAINEEEPIKKDEEYEKAIHILEEEININRTAWLPNPNPKNLPALISKLGLKLYGTNDYVFTINRMKQDGIISNEVLWLEHEYNENHIKSLIKKVSNVLG